MPLVPMEEGTYIRCDRSGKWWLFYRHPTGKLEVIWKVTTEQLLDLRLEKLDAN